LALGRGSTIRSFGYAGDGSVTSGDRGADQFAFTLPPTVGPKS
jgi:hypothetical protein